MGIYRMTTLVQKRVPLVSRFTTAYSRGLIFHVLHIVLDETSDEMALLGNEVTSYIAHIFPRESVMELCIDFTC